MGMDGNVVLGKVESMDWFIDDSDGDCIAGSGGIISSAHDRVSGPVYCVPSTLRKKLTSVSDQVGARAAGVQIPLTRSPHPRFPTAKDPELDFGAPPVRVIAYRILDTLLGLDPIDWEERIIGDLIKIAKDHTIQRTRNLLEVDSTASPGPSKIRDTGRFLSSTLILVNPAR